LSAYGIASSDAVRHVELEKSILAPFADDALSAAAREAADAARAAMVEAGIEGEAEVSLVALMRFQEQLVNSLDIPVPLPVGPETGRELLERFHAEYQRSYGAGGADLFGVVEVFALRAKAAVASSVPPVTDTSGSARGNGTATDTTEVYWPTQRRWLTTQVFEGSAFAESGQVRGPALVELPHTTIAVPPEAILSTGARGEIRLHLAATAAAEAVPSFEGTR
jgi:N-methylhydantoinase A